MRAENHHFLRLLASSNFRDRIVDIHGLVAERVRHLDLDFHFSMLLHAEKHPVAFTGDERRRDYADFELLPADAGHVQQAVRLVRIAQHRRNTFLLEKLVSRARRFLKRRKRRRCLRLPLHRWRLLHRTSQPSIQILRLGRRETLRLLVDDDRALQLSAKLLEILFRFRVKVHDRPARHSVGAGRPSRRCDRQRMPGWTHDARLRRPARPGMRNRPRLQVYVGQAVLPELGGGPIIRLLQLRRTRQPRPDLVGQVLEVLHHLTVIADFAQDLSILRRKRARFIPRRPRRSSPDYGQHEYRCKHNYDHSPQVHSIPLEVFNKISLKEFHHPRAVNFTWYPSWPRGPLSGLVLIDVRSLSLRFIVFQRLSAPAVISHFFSVISQRPLGLCVWSFFRFSQLAAMPQSRAAKAGILGKNSCFAPLQSRAGPASYTDSILCPRVHTRGGAADILRASLRRQENRKSKTRATQSLSAECLAARGAMCVLVSCSDWLPAALDESSLSTGSHPHRYCQRRGERSGLAAAP